MRSFKTKKGTELLFIDLKGKDYLPVAQRVLWFREEYPMGLIETEPVEITDAHAIFKAEISVPNEKGEYIKIADGFKREDQKHFQDYIEKAQTSAIGRALALVGFGTQFAPDFDEGDRLADAPVERLPTQKMEFKAPPIRKEDSERVAIEDEHVPNPDDLGDFVPVVGRFKNKALRTIKVAELEGYLRWFFQQGPGKDREPSGEWKVMLEKIEDYTNVLRGMEPPAHIIEQIPF